MNQKNNKYYNKSKNNYYNSNYYKTIWESESEDLYKEKPNDGKLYTVLANPICDMYTRNMYNVYRYTEIPQIFINNEIPVYYLPGETFININGNMSYVVDFTANYNGEIIYLYSVSNYGRIKDNLKNIIIPAQYDLYHNRLFVKLKILKQYAKVNQTMYDQYIDNLVYNAFVDPCTHYDRNYNSFYRCRYKSNDVFDLNSYNIEASVHNAYNKKIIKKYKLGITEYELDGLINNICIELQNGHTIEYIYNLYNNRFPKKFIKDISEEKIFEHITRRYLIND